MAGIATSPLSGIRVVEVTNIYSGPFAGLMLAELGADVVKVESAKKPDLVRNNGPAGPYGVNANFYALNRGKRFVSVDATTGRGRSVLADLVAWADVFLHNIRPGKTDGIGLAYDELAARNPRLIYASISGLGSDGPDVDQRVYDYVIQARVGMVDYQRDVATGFASLVSQVLVDKTTAQAAVQAVLAALFVRERTGRGQHIEIPMIGVGLHFEWPDVMARFHSQLSPDVPLSMMAPHMSFMPAAALIVVRTSNGGEIAMSPLMPPWEGVAIALDRPDWVVDERFAELPMRVANLLALRTEVEEAARQFTTDELLARFVENDVAAGLVEARSEVHEDPQIRHLGLIIEQETGFIGAVRQPAPMWHFSDTAARHATGIGRTGEHTREVLGEAGFSAPELDDLAHAGVISWPT